MPDKFLTALRNSMRQLRSHLSPSYRQKASHSICNKIKQFEPYRRAKHIAFYQAFQGEIDLNSLWQAAPLQGKYCYFPVLQGESLVFLPTTPATPFSKNKYGILEPEVDVALARNINQLDLMLLPLVAFDKNCNRLGMGAGFYDKTLANNTNCFLLGLGYSFQEVPFLEAKPWDIRLDAVLTPNSCRLGPGPTGRRA